MDDYSCEREKKQSPTFTILSNCFPIINVDFVDKSLSQTWCFHRGVMKLSFRKFQLSPLSLSL